MGHKEIEQKNRLAKFIQKKLNDLDILPDCDWKELDAAENKLNRLANEPNGYAADSLEMEITNLDDHAQVIFAVYTGSLDTLRECVEAKYLELLQKAQPQEIYLCFIVHSMKGQILVDSYMKDQNMRKYLQSAFLTSLQKGSKSKIEYTYILLQEYAGKRKPVSLTNIVRHEILREPPIDSSINLERAVAGTPAVHAAICTVNLYQLVQIYNQVGDQLFHSNVRFGIPNAAGVEEAITRTLETEPECFFFKNNGISILAEHPQVYSLEPERFTLGTISHERAPDFSVVNGAQTVSAAAQYFFRLEYWMNQGKADADQKQQYENAKEKARVLVRIMYISEGGEAQQLSLASQISVALNRQKPIKIEDIAFTDPTVQKLVQYLQDNLRKLSGLFRLTRRGENTEDSKELQLPDFIRARLACAGQPGAARSSDASSILRFQDSTDGKRSSKYSIIFPEDWIHAESDADKTLAYKRSYQAIWFIHEISENYHAAKRKITDTNSDTLSTMHQDVLTVMQNGRWYFAAAVTSIMNGFCVDSTTGKPDYTSFAYGSINLLALHKGLPRAILLFAQIAVQIAAEKKMAINSNTFKSETLYQEIESALAQVSSEAHSSDISNNILKLNEHILQGQPFDKPAELPSENVRMAGKDYIVLSGEKRAVANGAGAMAAIAEYVLEHTKVPMGEILSECAAWITDSEEMGGSHKKYFLASHQIRVRHKPYWVGTHFGNVEKKKRLEKLCHAAAVDKGELGWYSWDKKEKIHKKQL